jgi:hypothetical protein
MVRNRNVKYWPGSGVRKSLDNDFAWWTIPCQIDWRTPNQTQRATTDFIPFHGAIVATSPVAIEANLRRQKK